MDIYSCEWNNKNFTLSSLIDGGEMAVVFRFGGGLCGGGGDYGMPGTAG